MMIILNQGEIWHLIYLSLYLREISYVHVQTVWKVEGKHIVHILLSYHLIILWSNFITQIIINWSPQNHDTSHHKFF